MLGSVSLSAMQSERLLGMPMLDAIVVVCLPALWVVCFVIFALRSAWLGAQRTDRIGRLAVSPYLPRVFMEFGYWMFTLPIALLLRLGVTANMVTAASLFFTVVGAVLFGTGHIALGGWTLLLAFSCDAWDGIIARKRGTSSISGEFLDATIDRYNDLIAFFGIMYYYRDDLLPLVLAALAAVGSTVTSYARAKGESVGIDPNVGYMQRHERGVYLGGAAVFSPFVNAWLEPNASHPHHYLVIMSLGLLALLTNVTAYMRTRFVIVGLRARVAASSEESSP
jgi:CDP-diacylglycerol--glycerol-3-phosphate 3-phosphatidyltransferase